MRDFEEAVKTAAEKSVLKLIADGGWIQPNYADRLKIPAEWIERAWGLVDTAKVQAQLADRIEKELADRIMNHLAAEMATDVKKILSHPERREALRAVARNHVDAICKGEKPE